MQVKITQRIISGKLANAQVGTVYPVDDGFGQHLIDIGAAQAVETKVLKPAEIKKKAAAKKSSPSSPAAKASPKKTATSR